MRALATALIAVLSTGAGTRAQQQPHAGYVYPAGGQRGTTLHVEVGGQFLNGARGVQVSGSGVRARVLDYQRPLNAQALTRLRDTAQALQRELQARGGRDSAIRQRLLALRETVASSIRRSANPMLSESVTLEITIAADADPGTRRLRVSTPMGVTEPLSFVVGALTEFREKTSEQGRGDTELAITMPAIVNGQLIPGDVERAGGDARNPQRYRAGDVDRYRFQARKGQQLVANVSARELMPYLADAVPGWIQTTLTLFDGEGRELLSVDDYRFQPDPVLHYEIPADGEYVLEIRDALYRGREDFVYRIAIGELPFLTGIFPLGGRAGQPTRVELAGWNLPARSVVMNAREHTGSMLPLIVGSAGLRSNTLPFAVDELPEVLEREIGTSKAQPVTVPVMVNGRIDRPGDVDAFSFTAGAGDVIVAEVYARRLQSPIDAVLELSDASGRRLAWNDDHDDPSAGLETHHADAYVRATLPATGRYFVRIADVQHKGGAEYGYRLRLSAPQPDFELRVSPSALAVSPGGTLPVTVTAIRKDGFTGDITLALADAPRAIWLSGGLIPDGQDQVRITLTLPGAAARNPARAAPAKPLPITLVGRATIAGRMVAHHAIPADDRTQAFAYHHLVVADSLWLVPRTRGATTASARVTTPQPVNIPVGAAVQLPITLPPAYLMFENLQFQLSQPPAGVLLGEASIQRSGATLTLQGAADGKAGLRGNLIVEITGERPAPSDAQKQRNRRVVLGVLPAIAFQLVAADGRQ